MYLKQKIRFVYIIYFYMRNAVYYLGAFWKTSIEQYFNVKFGLQLTFI